MAYMLSFTVTLDFYSTDNQGLAHLKKRTILVSCEGLIVTAITEACDKLLSEDGSAEIIGVSAVEIHSEVVVR